MKTIFATLLSVLTCLALSAQASADFHPLLGSGFSVPNVNGTGNVGNPQVGDLVFDTSTNAFFGYGGSTPGWLLLGAAAPQAPSVQILSNATCTATNPATFCTYTTPSGALYLRVRMVGAGGGGAGSALSASNNGGAGGNGLATIFGTSLLTANGGGGGGPSPDPQAPGSAGTASIGGGPVGLALTGTRGGGGSTIGTVGTATVPGGLGGASVFAGRGTVEASNPGGPASADTGSGGAGAGSPSSGNAGGGGGSGGYVDVIIPSPASSYSYAIGLHGSGGSSGTSGYAGGNGADGLIEVVAYFQ